MSEPATQGDYESMLKVSSAAQQLARKLEEELEEIAGEKLAFTLIVWTFPRTNYISNAPRALIVPELQKMLEAWQAGAPDIPPHKVAG